MAKKQKSFEESLLRLKEISEKLEESEAEIIAELDGAQGNSVELGGYYKPNDGLATAAMRPSKTFNGIIDAWGDGC